nr:YhdH/YhfP family quinone oxidoreductase [Pseudomonas sp.]
MSRFRAFRLHGNDGDAAPQGRLDDLSIDELSPGDVVIRVAYSSINYKDALAAAGRGRIVRHYPRIGGIDLTGVVESSTYDGVKPGDEVVVHGFGIGVDSDGGHSQYARVSGEWVMPLPPGLSLLDAAICGAAGYTAGLALHWMEHNGLSPAMGDVAVTGASGGVGSIAVDMLSRRGYRVCAMSGKSDAAAFLTGLGAAEVTAPPALQGKPMESARWAGVVDAVGGELLARMLAAVRPEGVVTSFGNAGGAELNTTVLPFILRGVKLLGINANSPMSLRREVWQKIATVYRPEHLHDIAQIITLDELPGAMNAMLNRATRGRTIVQMS